MIVWPLAFEHFQIFITFLDSYCSFGAPQYPGNEGSSQTVCLHLSNPIARSATVTLSQSPVPGVVATEGIQVTSSL